MSLTTHTAQSGKDLEASSSETLRLAFNALDVATLVFDRNERCILANSQAHKLIPNVDPDEIAGKAMRVLANELLSGGRLSLPADAKLSELAENYEKAVKDLVRDADVELIDGKILKATSTQTEEGGYIVTLRETSDGYLSERRSLELLATAFASVDMGIVLWDATLRVQICNDAWRDLCWNAEDGESIVEGMSQMVEAGLLELRDGETVAEAATTLVLSMHSEPRHYRFTKPDGRAVQITSFKTRFGGVLATATDITERQRAEAKEKEADELVRKIVEACPTTFLVTRLSDGHVLYCAPASRQCFGPITNASSFFLSPKDRIKYLEALLPTGMLNDHPFRFIRGDGTIMDGLTSARITELRGEQIIVSSTRDITEQLALQKQLDQQRESLHQAEKLSVLGELLAGISHELSTPLSTIAGYSLMLQECTDDLTLVSRIERISSEADRCIRIVETFLAMARERPPVLKPTDLNELLRLAVDLVGSTFLQIDAQITLEQNPKFPQILADRDQLMQVFLNLIINARQALETSQRHRKLEIRSFFKRKSKKVFIKFKDNGSGMEQQTLDRIFEPFYTTKEVGRGTGLGLAFAHRIVTGHGGTLAVFSTQNVGSTFWISLPCQFVH